MKNFHLPTLSLHILLLLIARLTISDYPDFFLGVAGIALILHFVWAVELKKNFVIPSGIALGLYALSGSLGFVTIDDGPFGMGGGGFAWFFYGIALAVSFAAHCILNLIRMSKKR